MAARRKDSTPPFEIMGPSFHEPQVSKPVQQVEPDMQSAPGTVESAAATGPWWGGSGMPIVLRLPRGMAVLMIVGVLLLLLLAYWVGFTRGQGAAERHLDRQLQAEMELNRRTYRRLLPVLSEDQPVMIMPETENSPEITTMSDSREMGLNYMVLARYQPDEAARLAEFLLSQGVATVLDPVQNGRFYLVIAVNQGFSADQLSSGQRREYEAWLKEIGISWWRYNGNKGDKLETMYFDKYERP